MIQKVLFDEVHKHIEVPQFKTQLLKWVGNKQKFSNEIVSFFPIVFNRYFEPFLGSGAVLATLSPQDSLASDAFSPLIDIFITLKNDPELLKEWYRARWSIAHGENKKEGYEKIKASFNKVPNGADFLFLCRSCYGGVIRFRKADGYMSTPCGVHEPISPKSFNNRVDLWNSKVKHTEFKSCGYQEAMREVKAGDLVYCDPPYKHSQTILYGGQDFKLEELFKEIEKCKARGAFVALSIDGTKKSGGLNCSLPIPNGLFEEEIFVNVGRSMLKRFQMEGKTLENEIVSDRLLLTYSLPL